MKYCVNKKINYDEHALKSGSRARVYTQNYV